MTTMAALLGGVPLALGTGTGSELRRPLGIAIVGGLIFSQLLTLYTTPVIYLAFDRLALRFTREPSTRGEQRSRATEGAMNISAPFITRPIGTTLLTIAVGLAGAIGYLFLPVSPLPEVEFPTIQVSANLPGASPETMASSVATPLERQFGRIAGVTEMTSASQLGSTQVIMQFDLTRNIDARRARRAGGDQRRARAAAGEPAEQPDLPQGQSGRRADHHAGADVRRRRQRRACTTSPRPSCSRGSRRSPASARCSSAAARCRRCASRSIPTVLNTYGLGLEDVRARLGVGQRQRAEGPACDRRRGRGRSAPPISCSRRPNTSRSCFAIRNGAAVQLTDVGDVVDSVEDIRTGGSANGKPAVLLIVFRQPGANIIDTVDRIVALLPALQASIPPTTKLSILSDRTTTIRASVRDVEMHDGDLDRAS